jgi:hypothetical protein
MIDAGERARAQGKSEFSEISDLKSAIPRVLEQIEKFNKWAAVAGTLRLDYDLVAFSPDRALDLIEKCMGITADRAQAKSHAFENAFTQMNKGRPNRAREELNIEQYALATQAFADFIRNVCEGDGDVWLASIRSGMLARIGAASLPAASHAAPVAED